MLSRKIYIFVLTVVAAMLAACATDDMSGADRDVCEGGDEMPVAFDISLPATRAIENPKTKFTNGDVIHIQGTFLVKLDGQTELQERIRYGAMQFDGKKWTPLDGSDLKWPNTAQTGTFKAYFISGSTGVLYHEIDEEKGEDHSRTRTYLLSKITPDGKNSDQDESWSDPLMAENNGKDNAGVEYGYAVALNFQHICAYLTLEELEPAVSDNYWFSTPESNEPLQNAFYLSLTENFELEFNKVSIPEAGYTVDNKADGAQLYCISGKANSVERTVTVGGGDGSEGETKTETITVANYFVFPGDYSKFVLSYPTSIPTIGSDGTVVQYGSTQSYMSYDYYKIPEDVGGAKNIKPKLEAGRTYVLNVTKSPGTTITIPPDGEGWDESDDYTVVDPKTFFEHVTNGWQYEKDGTLILEEVTGGTRLRRNVDFKGEFGYWKTFQPNLPSGRTFDGDYHYIRNAGGQLFHFNDGTIKNLGVKNIKVDFETFETEGENKDNDMSRLGALCMFNHPTGIIENIRMENVTVKAHILTVDDDSPEAHNIGCILGSNTGRMSQVALSGTLMLTVDKSGDSSMDASVNIGGIVGQNAARIEDVSSLDDALKVVIYNNCNGPKAAFYVGGIAGQNIGYIDSVILTDVTVDGSGSSGNGSYMGGMVGESKVSTNNDEEYPNARLSSCIIGGTVRPGTVIHTTNADSGMYTGGIAGALQGVPVDDCKLAVSVVVPTDTQENVTYATGGAFGRIRIPTSVTKIFAYGSALSGPAEYIGNFAGIVPEGETWETAYRDKNNIVRSFSSIENIGAYISQ